MAQGEAVQQAARAETQQARGASGLIGVRQAQIIAVLITLVVFGMLGYGLDLLFTTLDQ